MTTQFTPGPWLREGNTIYALMHAGWKKGEELFKNRFHAYVQADRECPDDEHEANTRLIAAAPELLEALKDMLLEFDGSIGSDESPRIAKARAAIDKATGAAS